MLAFHLLLESFDLMKALDPLQAFNLFIEPLFAVLKPGGVNLKKIEDFQFIMRIFSKDLGLLVIFKDLLRFLKVL